MRSCLLLLQLRKGNSVCNMCVYMCMWSCLSLTPISPPFLSLSSLPFVSLAAIAANCILNGCSLPPRDPREGREGEGKRLAMQMTRTVPNLATI